MLNLILDVNGIYHKTTKIIFRRIDPNIPGEEAYDINVNKLKGIYKKVDDDSPRQEIYNKDGVKHNGLYIENDTRRSI